MRLIRFRLIALVIAGLVVGAAIWVNAGTTGIISGVVRGEDGKALSGANVIISGVKLSTVTDANGFYAIANVPPGEYEVRAEMVGYASAGAASVSVTMDATAQVNFDMKQEAIKEATAVVSRPRPMITLNQTNTLNTITSVEEKFTRTDPSSVNTVPGVLSTLPGVVVEPNGTGLAHIRGCKPEQIGYYIEGIPITDPNLGTFSDNLFSTGISKFQVYTGGFGAEFGNALGGVMNEVKKTGESSAGMRMTSYAGNGDYRNGIAEFGGGTPGGFNYYAGTIMQRNDMSGTPLIASQTYNDSVVKFVWPWQKDTLTLIGLQGCLQGDLGTYFPVSGDFQRQRYGIAGAIWSHNFDSKSFLTVRPYYIHVNSIQSMNNSGVVFVGGPYSLDYTSDQTGLAVGYTNQLNDKQLLKFGGSLLAGNNNSSTIMVGPWSTADVNTFQSALYAEQQYRFSPKFMISTGARYEGITYDRTGNAYSVKTGLYDGSSIPNANESAIMPRLGVSYSSNSRTAWKVNWGKYMKFVPADSVQTIYANPADPSAEAAQAGIGSTTPQQSTGGDISWERQFTDAFACRITPFYSNYTHLGTLSTDNTGVTRYMDLGKAESRGVELAIRKKLADKWQGWFSYTYQTIKSDDSGSGMAYTSWDRRHTFSLVADYKNGKWSHNLRADMGSGMNDVYPTDAVAKRAAPYAIFTYGLSLDLPKGSAFGDSISLSIYNLLNNRQVAEYEDGAADSSSGFRYGERTLSVGFNKGL